MFGSKRKLDKGQDEEYLRIEERKVSSFINEETVFINERITEVEFLLDCLDMVKTSKDFEAFFEFLSKRGEFIGYID